MKQLIYVLFVAMTVTFMSCNKENLTPQEAELNNRSTIETQQQLLGCPGCEYIQAEIEQGPIKDGCCTAILKVKNEKPCRELIVINGDTVDYVIDEYQEYQLVTCPGQITTVVILGFNEESGNYDKVCFKEDLECGKCSCKPTFLGAELIEQEGDCCIFNVKGYLTEQPEEGCEYTLQIGKDTFILNNQSISKNIKVCQKDVVISISVNGIVCKSDTLSCKGCCDGISYNINSLGALPGGCCSYDVNISNEGKCKVYLFDEGFNVLATINPQTSTQANVQVCPGGSITETFFIGTSKDEICEKFDLAAVCEVNNCCKGLTFKNLSLGANEKGCCEYKITVINNTKCTQYLYNQYGYLVTIPIGGTYTDIVAYCYDPQIGITIEYYVGPDTNINNACAKRSLAAVCFADQ